MALGVRRGSTLLVHSSLRRTRGVRAEALRDALLLALGPEGTLVVPSFTPENSDTSAVHRARLRGLAPWAHAALRAAMPPFDPTTTPAPGMGVLAETIRTTPGALRSGHPQTSFTALGRAAAATVAGHREDCHLGEHSPLGALYRVRADVLLLGVGFDKCSAFHLAEYRVPRPPRRSYRCVVRDRDRDRPMWWAYEDVVLDDSDFALLGGDFARSGPVATGTVADAPCRLFGLAPAVDFATAWLPSHRGHVQ
ncbi:aminoglycoside 3-N-acetyltransferase [Actinacidiphila guanduensis]|uniref:Aminoglycoside N(3)-acetyltransferase n=1 Tax=Actinacidiphila guanduensis TaxID=310781 RepID=A0A1H0E1P8_9ACTN|nr:aminoglycoside 3-N-acetyltransferase [Actinacidiphila guanduensis]